MDRKEKISLRIEGRLDTNQSKHGNGKCKVREFP